MQAIGKKAIIGGALSVLTLVAIAYFARPNTSVEAQKVVAIPDRMETYRTIDVACSGKQNRSTCLADLLAQTEAELEQTLGAKLKDIWPAVRDASCPDTDQDTLNRCRIYETLKFETQTLIFRQSNATTNRRLVENVNA